MSLSPDVKFHFSSKAVAEDFFQVLQFTGSEKLADLYQFDIQLLCQSEDYDLDELLSEDCQLTLDVYGEERIIHGVLSDFKYQHPTENAHLYQATLVPKLWRLTQITTNEIYLAQDLPTTLEQILQEADLNPAHYDLSLLSGYRKWDYRCQFGESHYNFLKRITEREGVYFYFEQSGSTEKIIFCDTKNNHPDQKINSHYYPLTGIAYEQAEPITFQWTKNSQRIPKKVTVKDYNNDRPSEDLSATIEVDQKGFGEVFRYCENLIDKDEAEHLVQIRSEEILTHKAQFFGASLDVRLQLLNTFELTEHPLMSLNDQFIPIELNHAGYSPGLQFIHQQTELPYSNEIKALKYDVQYRPEQTTEKPRFYGVLNAIVDSEGEGKYAHLDERGRYKVILPFDRVISERNEAQASWWIPMAQPNAGENSGMHFPLLKGAEVLLSFIAGDPDRPIITGAVPNAAKPSVVREDNHTVNKIKTASNNIIEMEDEQDNERIKLYSPNSSSYFHLGAANPVNANGIMMITSGGLYQEIGGGYQITLLTSDYLEKALHRVMETGDHDNNPDTPDTTEVKKDEQGNDVTYQDGISDSTERIDILDGEDIATDLINEQQVYPFSKSIEVSSGDPSERQLSQETGQLSGEFDDESERDGKHFFLREVGDKYFYCEGNTYTFFNTTIDFAYGGGYGVHYIDFTHATKTLVTPSYDGGFEEDWYKNVAAVNSNMLVDKTIGNTYEYQAGKSESVLVGDTDEYHKGFSKSVHNGSSNERTYGPAATAGEAIAAKLEGAVHATDIAGKLSGLSVDASAQLINVDIGARLLSAEFDWCAVKVAYSGAEKEYVYSDGEDSQMAQKSIYMKSPEISFNAGPVALAAGPAPTKAPEDIGFIARFAAMAEANKQAPGVSKLDLTMLKADLEAPIVNVKSNTTLTLKGSIAQMTGQVTAKVSGKMTSVEGENLTVKGKNTTVSGAAALTLKSNAALKLDGSMVNASGKATVSIKGAVVQLG